MESVLAIEMPDPGDGAIAAASFVATEVDDRGDVVYGHFQEAPVTSGKCVSGGSIDGIEGLALALQVGLGRAEVVGGLVFRLRVVRLHVTPLRENDWFPPVQHVRASR